MNTVLKTMYTHPLLSIMGCAYATGIVISIVAGLIGGERLDELPGIILIFGTIFPAIFMFRLFVLSIPIIGFIVFSYWYSYRNREFYFLRLTSSTLLGIFWVILVLSSFDYPFIH